MLLSVLQVKTVRPCGVAAVADKVSERRGQPPPRPVTRPVRERSGFRVRKV